jgi:hypothetical protein
LFVTGDDLGQPGETVTESLVCEVLMRFVANKWGWIQSHLERVLHEGDDDPVHPVRKGIARVKDECSEAIAMMR